MKYFVYAILVFGCLGLLDNALDNLDPCKENGEWIHTDACMEQPDFKERKKW